MQCVVPENVHTSPLWKFQVSFMHFLIFWSDRNPKKTPQEISDPLCGGSSMDIFWNCSILNYSSQITQNLKNTENV